ncbi:ubiquinol-cytochrome-c reductase complex assembly factor 6 [Microplitis mediator]|uniref:ubiquinol-cytochrome-c reductase complex assembly factor 6 n=1 Tax=Microplitis mediator TaxID=375433 RepID=UPI002557403D|nr:ubiquinol-cytochrome-c reductase complex assembly factor 6 [Microplitis mediator]
MPAGASTGEYIRFFIAAMISAFAGSQLVHTYYRPLDDMDQLVEEEIKRRTEQLKQT